jgi:hypothetical protein
MAAKRQPESREETPKGQTGCRAWRNIALQQYALALHKKQGFLVHSNKNENYLISMSCKKSPRFKI